MRFEVRKKWFLQIFRQCVTESIIRLVASVWFQSKANQNFLFTFLVYFLENSFKIVFKPHLTNKSIHICITTTFI